MTNIDNARVTKDLLKDVVKNIDYNKNIIGYYDRLSKEPEYKIKEFTLKGIAERVSECNSIWSLDLYRKQKIKDFKRTNLCTDKFCNNCKKVKQASRMAKYIPHLEEYKDKLYHLTLTLPNVEGHELKDTIKNMAVSFKKLVNYLTGYKKIKGIDFSLLGYEGAVRSLEITFNKNKYHPHFHVGIVFSGSMGKKIIENTYSFDYRSGIPILKRLFSPEEVMIQKIWYLLINGEKVTKNAIDELEEGYSCSMDKFREDDYAELFKYMTKATDEEEKMLNYKTFKDLYVGLYRVKQIQGYGCLYRIKDSEDLEEFDRIYDKLIENLQEKENPVSIFQTPQDLISDSEYTIISRKSYFTYLRKL